MAMDLVDEFVAGTEEHAGFRLQFLPNIARVLAAHDEVARLEELASQEDRIRNVRTRIALDAARAILAEAKGDLEDAVERYGNVAAQWLSYGSIPERAYALVGQGRCRLGLGDPGGAESLRIARETFEALGAEPALAEIDELARAQAAATS